LLVIGFSKVFFVQSTYFISSAISADIEPKVENTTLECPNQTTTLPTKNLRKQGFSGHFGGSEWQNRPILFRRLV